MLKWIKSSGVDVHLAFPNDFLVDFPARYFSQVGKVTEARGPSSPPLTIRVNLNPNISNSSMPNNKITHAQN